MSEPDWVEHAVLWHLYPLGFLGAERTRTELAPGEVHHRLPALEPWLDHAVELGASAVLLGPVFDSLTHFTAVAVAATLWDARVAFVTLIFGCAVAITAHLVGPADPGADR